MGRKPSHTETFSTATKLCETPKKLLYMTKANTAIIILKDLPAR